MITIINGKISGFCLENETHVHRKKYLMVEKGTKEAELINDLIDEINFELCVILQSLDYLIPERQIPRIVIRPCYVELLYSYDSAVSTKNRVRLFANKDDEYPIYDKLLKAERLCDFDNSYLLELLVTHKQEKSYVFSFLNNSGIIINADQLKIVIVDLILDIIMFNSFSFFCSSGLDQYSVFYENKYMYFLRNKLPCYYDLIFGNFNYYSFAYSARTDDKKINIQNYQKLWDGFINEYYTNQNHEEKPVEVQLMHYIDFNQLPRRMCEQINNFESGTYFLIRIIKEMNNIPDSVLLDLFGTTSCKRGKTRIIKMKELIKYINLIKGGYISAFKVINLNP